jgi:hypothetical protein
MIDKNEVSRLKGDLLFSDHTYGRNWGEYTNENVETVFECIYRLESVYAELKDVVDQIEKTTYMLNDCVRFQNNNEYIQELCSIKDDTLISVKRLNCICLKLRGTEE